jgi:hypothetical protein
MAIATTACSVDPGDVPCPVESQVAVWVSALPLEVQPLPITFEVVASVAGMLVFAACVRFVIRALRQR